jgi:hypothetical protein
MSQVFMHKKSSINPTVKDARCLNIKNLMSLYTVTDYGISEYIIVGYQWMGCSEARTCCCCGVKWH